MARTTKAPSRTRTPRAAKLQPRYMPPQPRAAPEGGIVRLARGKVNKGPRRPLAR
jgi:hypothetical protein